GRDRDRPFKTAQPSDSRNIFPGLMSRRTRPDSWQLPSYVARPVDDEIRPDAERRSINEEVLSGPLCSDTGADVRNVDADVRVEDLQYMATRQRRQDAGFLECVDCGDPPCE